MSAKLTPAECVAAEAAFGFLRHALDSLEYAEHFAATARLPEAYAELRAARQSLNQAADRLNAAAQTVIPMVRRTYLHGKTDSAAPIANPSPPQRSAPATG
jgi:hypothetical protein